MNWNWRLYKAIRDVGLKQKDFAALVNEDPSVISRVINGVWIPNEAQKFRYARALRKAVQELFGHTAE